MLRFETYSEARVRNSVSFGCQSVATIKPTLTPERHFDVFWLYVTC